MKLNVRLSSTLLASALVLSFTPCPAAAGLDKDKNPPDEHAISQLEQRAQQANPRDRCFLYAELVSAMTDMAGKQILDGETDRASATLKKIEHYAELIHLGLANDTKRLKNAQMLMHRTTYRLREYMHQASGEDQATLQATLKQLNQVQDELLTQVFSH
jgi:hypothetical protein